jgi:hypothetical protein
VIELGQQLSALIQDGASNGLANVGHYLKKYFHILRKTGEKTKVLDMLKKVIAVYLIRKQKVLQAV